MTDAAGTRKSLAVMALAVWTALLVVAAPAMAGDGPDIGIEHPEEGQFLTQRHVLVEGNATPVPETIVLGDGDWQAGNLSNVNVRNGNLTFSPKAIFIDDFGGPTLDTTKWSILEDPENVSIEDGALKLNYVYAYPYPTTYPMVKSVSFETMENADFVAEWNLKFMSYGYSASGGGISSGKTEFEKSHMSVKSMYTYNPPAYSYFTVLADGEAVVNWTSYNFDYHHYVLVYKASIDRYYCYMDNELVASFYKDALPNTFWFGYGELGTYPIKSPLLVDYVEVWALAGLWESDTIDLGHRSVLDGLDAAFASTHPQAANVLMWAATSDNAVNWTEWVRVTDGVPETPMEGRYARVKAALSIPGVKNQNARITLTGIRLDYHAPLASVEVRLVDGEWMTAQGLERWSASLDLAEDENVIEVRVTDVAGEVSLASRSFFVDTTPPVGTVMISHDVEYANDPDVTLQFNATDRYGVAFVEISNAPDFKSKGRFAYAEELRWSMTGAEGDSWVYARFIDSHGLVSSVVSDNIFFDTIPPMADMDIDQGAEYTPRQEVALEFVYFDNILVTKVEVANEPTFSEAWEVPLGETQVSDWKLAEGGDGVRQVYIRVTDVAGNVQVESDSIVLYWPKAIGSITINGGADLTGTTTVTLGVTIPLGTIVHLMQISNDPSFEGAAWEKFAKDRIWTLDDQDGTKTVHVRFLDHRDIVSLPVTDTIRMDTTDPLVTLVLDGGAVYTTDTSVVAAVTYDDASPPVRMWVSDESSFERVSPRDYCETFAWALVARESDHTVYVRVEDEAGHMGVASAIIHYASIRPIIKLSLPQGKVTRSTDVIPLNITPTDPYGKVTVQVAWNADPPEDSPWLSISGLLEIEVPEGTRDGTYQIRARARNAAGLQSQVVHIDVTIDTVAPSLAILHPEDGGSVTQRGLRVLLKFEVTDKSLISELVYIVDEGEPKSVPWGVSSTNLTLSGFGDHVIELRAEDAAGNVATSTCEFNLEDADAVRNPMVAGAMAAGLLVILCSAAVASYSFRRARTPGLRSVKVQSGDGWHEDYTHPFLEEGEAVDAARAPVLPTEPPVLAEEAPDAETTGPALEKVKLESVELPPGIADGPAPGSGDDWEEF